MSNTTCDNVSAATTPAMPNTKTSSINFLPDHYVATRCSIGKYVCALKGGWGGEGSHAGAETKARKNTDLGDSMLTLKPALSRLSRRRPPFFETLRFL